MRICCHGRAADVYITCGIDEALQGQRVGWHQLTSVFQTHTLPSARANPTHTHQRLGTAGGWRKCVSGPWHLRPRHFVTYLYAGALSRFMGVSQGEGFNKMLIVVVWRYMYMASTLPYSTCLAFLAPGEIDHFVGVGPSRGPPAPGLGDPDRAGNGETGPKSSRIDHTGDSLSDARYFLNASCSAVCMTLTFLLLRVGKETPWHGL